MDVYLLSQIKISMVMKAKKFRKFVITTKDGETIPCKAPSSKLTEEYAKLLAYHWAKIDKSRVETVKGID